MQYDDSVRIKHLLLFISAILFFSQSIFGAQRNVLLITIDTLRADYLRCNGSTKVATPNLDSLAANGVNFTRARTAVPLTLPSHAGILTGLYPLSHGVRDNGRFRLDDSFLTLAEVFRNNGYATAAFVGSFVLDHRFGLDQGFDVYDDGITSDTTLLENPEAERKADAVFQAFAEWLRNRDRKRPFFAWIHFYDPHAPYDAPRSAGKLPSDLYAEEIAYTDSITGLILDEFRRQGMPDVMIAVAGDHGEGLGEHQESTHSILIYNSTLHVPMILTAPGLLPAGLKLDALTRTIDLAPTILDFLGIQKTFGEGTSLREIITQKKQRSGFTSYSESFYSKLNLGWSELRGLEDEKFHFIMAPNPELYDVQKDPAERVNKISQLSAVATNFRVGLSARLEKQKPDPELMDPETEEKLRSLGYIASTPRRFQNGIDPKDKMRLWNEIQRAILDFHESKFQAVVQTLLPLAAQEKNLPLIYEYLASAQMKLRKNHEAQQTIQRALQNGVESASLHQFAGMIAFQSNTMSKAETEFKIALVLNPFDTISCYYLGQIHRSRGELRLAIAQFERALEINSRYVPAWNGLGAVRAMSGQHDAALAAFQEVVRLDPNAPQGHFNLALQLDQMNRRDEAVQRYRKFLEIARDPEYAEQRRRAEAAIEKNQ